MINIKDYLQYKNKVNSVRFSCSKIELLKVTVRYLVLSFLIILALLSPEYVKNKSVFFSIWGFMILSGIEFFQPVSIKYFSKFLKTNKLFYFAVFFPILSFEFLFLFVNCLSLFKENFVIFTIILYLSSILSSYLESAKYIFGLAFLIHYYNSFVFFETTLLYLLLVSCFLGLFYFDLKKKNEFDFSWELNIKGLSIYKIKELKYLYMFKSDLAYIMFGLCMLFFVFDYQSFLEKNLYIYFYVFPIIPIISFSKSIFNMFGMDYNSSRFYFSHPVELRKYINEKLNLYRIIIYVINYSVLIYLYNVIDFSETFIKYIILFLLLTEIVFFIAKYFSIIFFEEKDKHFEMFQNWTSKSTNFSLFAIILVYGFFSILAVKEYFLILVVVILILVFLFTFDKKIFHKLCKNKLEV